MARVLFSVLAALAAMSASPVVASTDGCRGSDGTWSLGGMAFDATPADQRAFSAACRPGSECELRDTDGVIYNVIVNNDSAQIVHKRRDLRPGEILPYGLSAGDTPQQAWDKIAATGARPRFQATGVLNPSGVAVGCNPAGGRPYFLEFDYDAAHHMTGIGEGPIFGPGWR